MSENDLIKIKNLDNNNNLSLLIWSQPFSFVDVETGWISFLGLSEQMITNLVA